MPSVTEMTTVDASVFQHQSAADLSLNNGASGRVHDDGSINLADDELMCMIDSIGKFLLIFGINDFKLYSMVFLSHMKYPHRQVSWPKILA